MYRRRIHVKVFGAQQSALRRGEADYLTGFPFSTQNVQPAPCLSRIARYRLSDLDRRAIDRTLDVLDQPRSIESSTLATVIRNQPRAESGPLRIEIAALVSRCNHYRFWIDG